MPSVPFGQALQLRRIRAGLSLSGLSGLVHYSPSYLSRVESGKRGPSQQLARLCDTALGANGELSGLVTPPVRRAASSSPSALRPDATQGLPDTGDDSAPPPPSALCPAALPAVDDGEDARSATHFAVHLVELRRLAQRMSPTPVLRQVSGAIDLLATLARAARTPAARRQYLELLAFHCEFAGWMAQESGRLPEAERWIGRTEGLAVEAGAFDLADHTLIRRAGLALYQGDARSVTEYAAEAGRRARNSPRIQALAAFREAQGLALAGSSDLCAAALDRAGELLEAAVGPSLEGSRRTGAGTSPGARHRPLALVVGSECTSSLGDLVEGWCLYDLGRPDEAAAMIRTGLGRLPVRATRLRALFTARLTLGLAASGELDAVVPVVDGLLKDSEGLCSHVVRTQLRMLASSLRRRHARPDMRELHARVTAALRCAGCAMAS
ncbi:helix-turn-helix domain-containing protein [Streptomyces tailanensis]|uniref:helix-turn-helix domain-containing protein n=1 Tax=Streptomyces tailanensis TaxID=2569858 RepID=UPI00155AF7FF|nr:helix-turn-helix domain-containing protein [Streptomyces tailanensis]